MKIKVAALRQRGANDHAIVDLLQLVELGMVPGRVSVDRLRELWGCSQSQVSRRMNAIADLGLCRVRSGWGSCLVTEEAPLPKRALPPRPETQLARLRWENLRRRWREVVV